jgi:hypothetical protein
VTIQSHLVRIGGFGDGVDANTPDPVFAEQIPGCADDAIPRSRRDPATVLHGFLQENLEMSLDRV